MHAPDRPAAHLRRRAALLMSTILAILSLALAACSAGSGGSESAASGSAGAAGSSAASDGQWPRTIATDDGEVTLESKPERIVSTSVTLTGSLLAIDAPVVASGATDPNNGLSDDKGFFLQWSKAAQDKNVAQLWTGNTPDVQTVLGYEPDLIIVSKSGADSALDHVDQLRDIAPVLVIDYGAHSWQDVTTTLAQATGQEDRATSIIEDYSTALAQTKEAITVPEGETSALIVSGDGTRGAAALTDVSPQVQLLKDLGFTMATVPEEVKGDTSMGERNDIVRLSPENVQKGLTGSNWVVVAADDQAKEAITGNPAFSTAPAVVEGRVAYTPATTFRLDYYSALEMLDSLKESYAA